ncbi:MAG: tRNA (adenosine(37)-N6)-dimethylallyltransferase MiaA, partial [Candidatus Eremiobacteraeota bacterium]|nr:tRNA (adenosine(37)-N6)-dimethylallyltransferase MiaA [Candidatus Eremiobacteraeota bacterium]
RAMIPHHLIDFLDPNERYSAARYASDAVAVIERIHAHGKRAIVVGGTGFYIRALTGGVTLAPQYDAVVRERLAAEARRHDAAFLHDWLATRDPSRAAILPASDRYRVLRALEVALAPRTLRDDVPARTLGSAGIAFETLYLEVDSRDLDARISARTDTMLAAGLLEEAQSIGAGAVAASAVGYPQALAFLSGWCTLAELRTLLIRATRRYAKRQGTWFRSEPGVVRIAREQAYDAAREKLGWA